MPPCGSDAGTPGCVDVGRLPKGEAVNADEALGYVLAAIERNLTELHREP
jgi:hypothetical protein